MTVQLSPILQELYDLTVERLKVEKKIESERDLLKLATFARKPHSFFPVRADKWPHIIAEIKLASPSEGDIAPRSANPVKLALTLLKNGAAAISVVTEPSKFKGDKEFLRKIHQVHPEAKLLMKDFFIDWYQLLQARVYGADAILLIVDFIERELLLELAEQASWLGLTTLVEVHNPEQLEWAISHKFWLIGVNNRDLRTMEVSLDVSREMAKIIQGTDGVFFISESGIKRGADIAYLTLAGYRAFLVGTLLMRSRNPGVALNNLREDALKVL